MAIEKIGRHQQQRQQVEKIRPPITVMPIGARQLCRP
jgi:hypothetical protein